MIVSFILLMILCGWNQPAVHASAAQQDEPPTDEPFTAPTVEELIAEINDLRQSYGIAPLAVHPALMKIAQQEANGIAASDQGGHWRPYGLTLGQWLIMEGYPLSGDLTQDGYRSENWGIGFSAKEVFEKIHGWVSSGDDAHTNTMLSTDRSDIGLGVATCKEFGKDEIVFVIETALQTRTGQQQSEAKDFLTRLPDIINGGKSINGTPLANGQYIIPVALSTARPDGSVFHVVQYGQTLWSIAIYYGTTIEKIRDLNNLGEDNTVYENQRLLIKTAATQPVPTADVLPTLSLVPALETPTAIPPATTPNRESQTKTAPQEAYSLAMEAVLFAILMFVVIAAFSFKNKG